LDAAADPGWVVKKIYFWVLQTSPEDKGAAAVGFQDSAGLSVSTEMWTTRADVVTDGVLQEGVAFATGLAIVEETTTHESKIRWWLETVMLKRE
jgi:hypothetical protein